MNKMINYFAIIFIYFLLRFLNVMEYNTGVLLLNRRVISTFAYEGYPGRIRYTLGKRKKI